MQIPSKTFLKLSIGFIFIIGLLFSCDSIKDTKEKSSFENNSESYITLIDNTIERKVDSVIALMYLNEKIGQLVQYSGGWDVTGPSSSQGDQYKLNKLKKGEVGSMLNITSVASIRETQRIVMENSRLKIPLIFGFDVIHGYKTIFPIPLGESASWDLTSIEQSAAIAAKEASASGLNWTFAPMVDVSRDARWGRVMEGGGEDSYLSTQIAVARIKGFQGNDLSKPYTIAACAKHFAGYGFAEAGRDYNTVSISEYDLHNVILPPFKAAAQAGVATFMNAFNDLNGIPATGHTYLQRDLLKGKWNWEGFVVSDWGSIGEMKTHGYAKDTNHAGELAINAGSDMDMQSFTYEQSLKSLIEDNKISIDLIDDAVRRILRIKFQLGLFDDPYKYCNEDREAQTLYTEGNLAVARDVAKKSIVLLKNENQLLPLSKEVKSIAVIGPLADDKNSPLGNWRAKGEYNSAVSLLEGIKAAVSINTKVYYEQGVAITVPTVAPGENQFSTALKFNTSDRSGIKQAVEAAKKAEVVILAIGEDAYQSGEGRSVTDIGFKGLQMELLEEVHKVNKNIVIVLMNGRPMDLSRPTALVPSLLECWHLGSQTGYAIADVLFGDYNPSGKLPVSFPHNVGQVPIYYNQKNTGRPSNATQVTYSHYRDAPKTALYPFGFGLSYTEFSYSNLILERTEMPTDGELKISVTVENSGDRAGEEVVQLYIRDLVASYIRPVKELRDFKKINLKPGESKEVEFIINAETLQFYTANKKWEVEPGEFDVWVGGSSLSNMKQRFNVVK